MKKARRRIDVNLAELDRVLDDAREAPLSEADHGKLKDTLHAMAALLIRSRNTEKTSAVFDKSDGSEAGAGEQAAAKNPPPPGHGRKGAEAFAGARKVDIKHQTLTHGARWRSVQPAGALRYSNSEDHRSGCVRRLQTHAHRRGSSRECHLKHKVAELEA